jgi:uncharacterized protein
MYGVRRSRMAAVIALLLLASLGFVVTIGVRNYRAARFLIEADPPSSLLTRSADAQVENLQSVIFVSRGRRLSGWYIASKNHAAVIVTHGTNGDRAAMLIETRMLGAAGYGVLSFDWPGLGKSEGPVAWGAEAQAALGDAIDWIAGKPDVDPERIGGLGFSMGGYVLAQVAAKDSRLRAVVIESAPTDFDSYLEVHNSKWGLLSKLPARWALRNSGLLSGDSALQVIGRIAPRSLLIIAQSGDAEIPEWMARKLDAAAGPPTQLWLMRGSRHGGYAQVAGAEYERRVREFFDSSLLVAGAKSEP